MTDTSVATTDSGKTREAVAQRLWINAAGEEVTDPAEAIGFRYVDLPTLAKIKAEGGDVSQAAFTWNAKTPAGEAVTMLAIFGGLTKAGNIRNTLVNGPKGDANADVIQGIEDWFDELDNGTWAADRVGGGIRVNPDALAAAIAHVKGEHHDGAHLPYLAKISSKSKVKDPGDKAGKREILYSTFALRNTAVQTEYQKRLPQHSAAPAASDL